jgi:transcriptional regulator with XRE-family HTH domain
MIRLKLRQARIDRGMTIRALGFYAKVGYATISKFENGKCDISTQQLERICKILGQTIELQSTNDRSNSNPKTETISAPLN